jgi:hypothetical protein
LDWGCLLRASDEEAASKLTAYIAEIAKKHIPFKEQVVHKSSHPWLNARCQQLVAEKVAAFAEEFEPVSQNVLSMIGMLSAVTKADRVSTTDVDKHVLLGNQGLETVKLMQAILKLEENLTDGQLTDQGMSHAMQALAKSCKSMNKLKDAASKDADETSGLSIMFKVFDKSLCKWLLDVVVQSTALLRRQFEDSVFACKYLQDNCW